MTARPREAGAPSEAAASRPAAYIFMGEREYVHQPVLAEQCVRLLVRDPGGLYLDATVGLGGHAEAALRAAPHGRLLGLDLDPEALHLAERRLQPFAGRARLARANFRDLGQVLERERFFPLAGALFDLGVSSLQLDKPSRGFSFGGEGPLDMRLDPASPLTASSIVNDWPVEQLALLLKEFGEEKDASRVARWIAERRSAKRLETTSELAALLEEKLGRRGRLHPATRTFLALRIAVNRELENLTRGLEAVAPYLQSGGRLGVISFHSLEDRIVKNTLRTFVRQGLCREVTRSPACPEAREVEENPRARSAKLRVVEKR